MRNHEERPGSMSTYSGRLVLLLAPLLLAGCGGTPDVRASTQTLNDRLQTRLAQPLAKGSVALTPEPDGARVTLLLPPPPPAPQSGQTLDEADGVILASVIEGLLDPSLLQVQVMDTAAAAGTVDQPRVRDTVGYFRTYRIDASAQMNPAPTSPQGLTIAIAIHCPPSHGEWNWGYNEPYATCK